MKRKFAEAQVDLGDAHSVSHDVKALVRLDARYADRVDGALPQ